MLKTKLDSVYYSVHTYYSFGSESQLQRVKYTIQMYLGVSHTTTTTFALCLHMNHTQHSFLAVLPWSW